MGDKKIPRSDEATSSKLNTDEHPRVEFLTTISNRDGKLIRGKELERFYNDVLSPLPSGSAKLNSQNVRSTPVQRKTRQRLILFGN
jgi:spermidine synthase